VVSLAAYGAVAGFFQGGLQIAVAALKAPLIVLFGIVLCLPSLVVCAALAGADLSWRRLARMVAAFAATLGVLLASVGPIAWLFSVTSRSLAFLVFFHLATWGIALLFALRGLTWMLALPRARLVAVGWTVLLWLVVVQLTAYLGPVLERHPGEAVFVLEKGSFLEKFDKIFDGK
jgi:hypothetical protein